MHKPTSEPQISIDFNDKTRLEMHNDRADAWFLETNFKFIFLEGDCPKISKSLRYIRCSDRAD